MFTYLLITWCYTCSPTGWVAADPVWPTQSQCEQQAIRAMDHYRGESLALAAKDKFRHRAFCVSYAGELRQADEQGNLVPRR
jgi:hypothetical protein